MLHTIRRVSNDTAIILIAINLYHWGVASLVLYTTINIIVITGDSMGSEITLDQQLCFGLYGASIAILRAYKPLLDNLQITYPQYLVLSVLWEQGASNVGELAQRLALDSSTVTPLVKRLEQANFVVRRRVPEDERQVSVSLTDRGVALKERARCLGERLFVAAGMPPERLINLNSEVRAFRDAVTAFTVAQTSLR
jgi:MarR family transcriptional regulator, organic hydroperoxide resistance regulator